MRILLDENLDWRLERGLPGHEVGSVFRLGWAGTQNGLLLKKAEESGFEVFITMDSNIDFQQHLTGQTLKVFVLRARTNRFQDTFPLMAEVLKRLPFVQNGAVQVIE
jgi:hypothetical protein